MSVINYILENSPSSNKRRILAKGCQCEGNYSVGICLRYVAHALIHCVLVLKHAKGMALRYDELILCLPVGRWLEGLGYF